MRIILSFMRIKKKQWVQDFAEFFEMLFSEVHVSTDHSYIEEDLRCLKAESTKIGR